MTAQACIMKKNVNFLRNYQKTLDFFRKRLYNTGISEKNP